MPFFQRVIAKTEYIPTDRKVKEELKATFTPLFPTSFY